MLNSKLLEPAVGEWSRCIMGEAAWFFMFPAFAALLFWAGALDRWQAGQKLASTAFGSWAIVATFATVLLAKIG